MGTLLSKRLTSIVGVFGELMWDEFGKRFPPQSMVVAAKELSFASLFLANNEQGQDLMRAEGSFSLDTRWKFLGSFCIAHFDFELLVRRSNRDDTHCHCNWLLHSHRIVAFATLRVQLSWSRGLMDAPCHGNMKNTAQFLNTWTQIDNDKFSVFNGY